MRPASRALRTMMPERRVEPRCRRLPQDQDPDPAASSQRYRLPSLSDRGALVRLAAIGASVLAMAVCFAYVGGWFSPGTTGPGADRRPLRAGQWPPSGVSAQPRQGALPRRTLREHRAGHTPVDGVALRHGTGQPVTGRIALAGGQPYAADAATIRSAPRAAVPPPYDEEGRPARTTSRFSGCSGEGMYAQLLGVAKPDPARARPIRRR